MAVVAIGDFKAGMDRRRKRVAGSAGSLWTLKDAHITRGGDIERRKKFVATYALPVGTFSLASVRSQLYAFGSADLASTMPLGVQYQRLQAPSTPAMSRVLDVKLFQGKLYVIAEYANGNVYHFFDGSRVTTWDAIVTANANDVAAALSAKINRDNAVRADVFGTTIQMTARVPGTAYTVTVGATNGGSDNTQSNTLTSLQSNVAAVAETRSTANFTLTGGTSDPGTDTINSVTANGMEILGAAVDWAASNEATAIRVATEINNGSALHGYEATVVGAVITLTAAPGTGTTPNDYVLEVTVTGTVTVDADAAFASGVNAVTAVAQVEKAVIGGTIENADTFTVTINGTAYKLTGLASGMGTSAYVDKERVWSTAGRLWYYCKLGDATEWDSSAPSDAGFIDLTETTEATDNAVGAARYQQSAAVFSSNFIALYALDVDPTKIAIEDTLDNTGTDAVHAIVRYGNNDVFYLDNTGLRSLRARDASNAPFVSDVGNYVDTFIQDTFASLTQQQSLDAIGAIEPRDGRLWLAAGGYIFVLSSFPSAPQGQGAQANYAYTPTTQNPAWSYYQPDEFDGDDVAAMVRVGKQFFVRAGDTVFLYGGVDGNSYPEADVSPPTVELPFLMGDTTTFKQWTGFDIACTNEWEIVICYDPNDESRTIELGRVTKTTFNEMYSALNGQTTMVAPKLVCNQGGAATISAITLHYEATEAE